jgi:hypothetical protein
VYNQLIQAYLGSHETAAIKDSLLLAPEPVKQNAWYKVAYGHLLLAEGAMIEQAGLISTLCVAMLIAGFRMETKRTRPTRTPNNILLFWKKG